MDGTQTARRGGLFKAMWARMTEQAHKRDHLAIGPQAPRAARRTLRDLERVLEPSVLHDARLLVTELVTNAYRHGPAGRMDAVEVCAVVTPAAVRVEVRDYGPGFEAPLEAGPAPRGDQGGWGLFLVEQIANRWGVHRGRGTLVWFELDRPAAAAAA